MINLKFINEALRVTDGNEFRVLYFIANAISRKKENRTKIYREVIADVLGLSTKQITRLTDSLVEKQIIKKDLVSDGDKTVNYYSLNLDKFVQQTTTNLDKNVHESTLNLDKNVPLNNIKKDIKKIKNKENNKKEINKENDIIENNNNLINIFNNIIKEDIIENNNKTGDNYKIDNKYILRMKQLYENSGSSEELKSNYRKIYEGVEKQYHEEKLSAIQFNQYKNKAWELYNEYSSIYKQPVKINSHIN